MLNLTADDSLSSEHLLEFFEEVNKTMLLSVDALVRRIFPTHTTTNNLEPARPESEGIDSKSLLPCSEKYEIAPSLLIHDIREHPLNGDLVKIKYPRAHITIFMEYYRQTHCESSLHSLLKRYKK